jgi:hypothetical protein
MLADQDTVGAHRAARKEQEELTDRKKLSGALTKEERMAKLREKEAGIASQPRHVSRPGKPLKR